MRTSFLQCRTFAPSGVNCSCLASMVRQLLFLRAKALYYFPTSPLQNRSILVAFRSSCCRVSFPARSFFSSRS